MNSWAITNLNLKPHAPEILASTDDARAAAGEPAPRVQTRSLAVATAETPEAVDSVLTTRCARGSMRDTDPSPTFATQIEPAPKAMAPAATPPRCCRSGRRS